MLRPKIALLIGSPRTCQPANNVYDALTRLRPRSRLHVLHRRLVSLVKPDRACFRLSEQTQASPCDQWSEVAV